MTRPAMRTLQDGTVVAEPLPCPFCGRAPDVNVRASNHHDTGKWFSIGCFCGGYSTCAYHGAPRIEDALARWNTRV